MTTTKATMIAITEHETHSYYVIILTFSPVVLHCNSSFTLRWKLMCIFFDAVFILIYMGKCSNSLVTENMFSLIRWIIHKIVSGFEHLSAGIYYFRLFAPLSPNKVCYESQYGLVGYPDGKDIRVLPKKVMKSFRKVLT